MTSSLRALLIVSAALVLFFIARKIRKSQIQALDALFWLGFSLSFVILALFPSLSESLAHLLGFQAASNFVFVYVIAVLVVRDFSNTLKYAALRDRFEELLSEIAINESFD